jgi:hypothetical protein
MQVRVLSGAPLLRRNQMPKVSTSMQKLCDLREGVLVELRQREREIEALRNKLKGVDAAIAAVGGQPQVAATRRNRNVKQTVMDLIVDAGQKGITAIEVVERAAIVGRQLDRPSVSSLLSRLKREGVLSFNGERYFPVSSRGVESAPGLKVVNS